MQAIINKSNIDTTFQDDLLKGISLSKLAVIANGTEQKTILNLLESGWDSVNGRGTFVQGFGTTPGAEILIIISS